MYARDGINNPLHWSCYFGDLMVTRLLVDKIPGLSITILYNISASEEWFRVLSYGSYSNVLKRNIEPYIG